jgi:hypothetical protein
MIITKHGKQMSEPIPGSQVPDDQLLDEAIRNARKAERNDYKVPAWLWPLIAIAAKRLQQERGVTLSHVPFHYIKVSGPQIDE